MDLPVWFMLAAVLLAVHADPADQGPQVFEPSSKPSPPSKVHKREPQYEMKEVLLYLTPSQIRAIEAGLIQPHELMHTQIHPEPQATTTPKSAPPSITDQIQEQMHNMKNILNDAGQKIQKEVKKIENNKKQQMQQESKESKANKYKEQLKTITPELNAPQSPQLDLQKREKFINFPLDLQLIPTEDLQSDRHVAPIPNLEKHIIPPTVPDFNKLVAAGEPEFNAGGGHQATQLTLPHFQLQAEPQLQHTHLHQGKAQGYPQNYAYLYFNPEVKPVSSDKYQLYYPQQEQKQLPQQSEHKPKEQPEHRPQESSTQEEKNQKEFLSQSDNQQKEWHFQINPRPQELVFQQNQRPKEYFLHTDQKPKEFIYHTDKDLKQLLLHQQYRNQRQPPEHNIFLQTEQLPKEIFFHEGQKLKPYQFQSEHHVQELISQPELHPLQKFHPKFDLVPYEYALQNKLEAQAILQTQLNGHEFYSHRLQAQKLEPQQADINTQHFLNEKEFDPHFLNQKELEPQYHPQENHQIELPQFAKAPTLKTEPKLEHLKESDIKEFHPRFQKELEKVMEAQKEQAKIQAQEQEAHRLDSELEKEQEKAEKFKAEQLKAQQEQNEKLPSGYLPPPTSLDILTKMEPKRFQMYSILKPLFQGYNIAESLEEQRAKFPHGQIQLEKGFKPLQYAPKYYGEEYAKELEKMERRNKIVKEHALAKAAAMANEPAEIIRRVEDKAVSYEVVKHVNIPVPTPVMVPVPAPYEVKVPQPYAVPLEIFRPVPVPILKMEKVEVEKPVPFEVEKRVPVPVTRNVYVKVDKPYYIEKVVPVKVKKEIPIEIPIRKPQKLSIIRHVWES